MPLPGRLSLCCAALLLLAPASPGPCALRSGPIAREEIGTKGATLDLGGRWRRNIFDEDVLGDQFVGRGDLLGCYLICTEIEGIFLVQEDFVEAIEDEIPDLGTEVSGARDPRYVHDQRRGIGHSSLAIQGKVAGLDTAWSLQLLGRDGLAYLLMGWGLKGKQKTLERRIEELAASFEMPPPGSDWARGTTPIPHRILIDSRFEVSIQAAPSIFRPAPDLVDPGDLALIDANRDFAIFGFGLDRSSLRSAEQQVLEDLEIEATDILSREEFSRDGFAGSLIRYRRGSLIVDGVLLELSRGRFLHLRIVGKGGPPERYSELRGSLLESLRIREHEGIDAFDLPAVAEDGIPADLPLGALLARGRRMAEVGDNLRHAIRTPRGLALAGQGRIELLADGMAETELLYDGEWSDAQVVVWRKGKFFSTRGDDGRIVLEDGVGQAVQGSGGPFASLPDGGWLESRPAPPIPPGFGMRAGGNAGLVRRSPSGEERSFPLDGRSVVRLDLRPEGALVVTSTDPVGSGRILILLDPDTGEVEELGAWRQVDCLAPAPQGWLVTGEPEGGVRGVNLLGLDGAVELLVSGTGIWGCELTPNGRLLLACYEPWVAFRGTGTSLYEIPLADVRESGPTCQPWNAPRLRDLAVAAAQDLGFDLADPRLFDEEDGPLALARTARSLAAAAGRPLPELAAGLDVLFNQFAGESMLGNEGSVLLAALLTEAMLGWGGQWVRGETTAWGPPGDRATWLGENAFAVAFMPLAIVRGLEAEDGWYSPVTTIPSWVDGREILLGADPRTLEAALDACDQALQSLGEAEFRELSELFVRHAGNVHLRGRVYRDLVQAGRFAAVIGLAAPFATIESPESVDVMAWLGARVAQGEAPVEELRSAYARFGDEQELLLLLGHVYRAQDGAKEKARACYQRVFEKAYGAVESDAREALESLDE